ncbi:MAG TPA: hypothetical protein VF827_00725, partial [Syntrophales bacterium]
RMRIVLLSLAGGSAGYILLHPYTMLVYGLYGHSDSSDSQEIAAQLVAALADSFHPGMISMGFPFALMGALIGLLLGFWLEARSRRFEMEKRLLAVDTLRQLMVTLAHHLLNAVQGIGGFAALALRKEKDEDKRRPLEIIKRESIKIEAVVKALQSLESVTTERYTKSSETLMIDIRKELQERMEALNKEKIESPR